MQSSPKVVLAGLALSIVLFSFAPVASAGPKEDVAASTLAWAQALGEDDPDKVLPLLSGFGLLTVAARRLPCGVTRFNHASAMSDLRP